MHQSFAVSRYLEPLPVLQVAGIEGAVHASHSADARRGHGLKGVIRALMIALHSM